MGKKNESTAVNDLINLVATQGPSVRDPGLDLFSDPPKKSRVTSTVASAKSDVAPLPRTRAPMGTQQNASLPPPPVRVSTVIPSRASSIPPIPGETKQRPSLPPPRPSAAMPRPPIPTRSQAAIAPPALTDVDVDIDAADLEADLLATPVHRQPRAVSPVPAAVQVDAGWDTGSELESTLDGRPTPAVATKPASRAMPVVSMPVPVVAPLTLPVSGPIAKVDMTDQSWFADSRGVDRVDFDPSASMREDTAQVQRRRSMNKVALAKKLALPTALMIVLGIFVGGYIAFDGQGGKKRTPSATPATPATPETNATATAKAVEPAATTEPAIASAGEVVKPAEALAPKPDEALAAATTNTDAAKDSATTAIAVAAKTDAANPETAVPAITTSAPAKMAAPSAFVDVRIDSTPSGATVMLVDNGKTSFLGTTPISASVDPARAYEVVFTYANKPTQIERLDPRTMSKLSVTLGKPGKTLVLASAKTATKPTEPKIAKAIVAPKTEKVATAPKAEKKAKPVKVATVANPFGENVEKVEPKVVEKAEAGEGVLMISSKPPCEIWVDGAATGLMTPQRAMKLAAGKHKITLVSPDKAHKKTVAVEITADKPTKVIQDLLAD